jgi:hypothetical protein
VRVHAKRCQNNGYSGRQLYRLFKGQGLESLVVEAFALPILSYPLARQLGRYDEAEREALSSGAVSAEEIQRFRAGLEQAVAEGTFFSMARMVMVGGRVPAS